MIVLASASPQRKALLEQIGIAPVVLPSNIPEDLDVTDIKGSLKRLARDKALASLAKYRPGGPAISDIWVIGADTVIWHDGKVICKLISESEARSTLESLSGKRHSVLTGICVQKAELVDGVYSAVLPATTDVADTKVIFKSLTNDDISWYLSTGEWREAAGAYRIQMRGACIVEAIEGSYSNVVGLPLERICGILRALGFRFEE